MINSIPINWKYTDDLEMLFLFYQCADELTSEHTNDTYMVPLHNAMTLTYEMEFIYQNLKKYKLIDIYYENNISVIIDEFLLNLKEDKVLKSILGRRLDSIITGFEEAKKNSVLLERWINMFRQCCDIQRYYRVYKEKIIQIIEETKEKKLLIEYTKRFFSSLVFLGYSREFIYLTTKRYFNNFSIEINNKKQIREYLGLFSCEERKWEFLVLIDLNSIEYLDSIGNNLVISKYIQKIDIDKERTELSKDSNVEALLKDYDKLFYNKSKAEYQKISIIRYESESIDQFRAIEEFEDHIRFIQSFSIYFKHHKIYRQIFRVLLKDDKGRYQDVKMPDRLLKRPYIKQEQIDYRIENIMNANSLSADAFMSLTKAISMHADALDSQNISTLIKSLWTSLESLFSTRGTTEIKSNVIDNTLVVIQKTYLLKVLRSVYMQISNMLSDDEMSILDVDSFTKFVEYFAVHKAKDMKELYEKLGNNILLRTRIFSLRETLEDGKAINQYLEKHEIRIRWQLQRIYRTRNMATHLGVDMYYSDIIVNHIHNYFDFIINYLLCKICNGDYVSSIASVVFEAKNDNLIYKEILKSKEELSKNNYLEYLFGPDVNLISYEFEG